MKRFVIKFPNGLYSRGTKNGRTKPVPFEKAKLWTNIGHVKNHLNGLPHLNGRKRAPGAYPPGCKILEVEITHTESLVMTVAAAYQLAEFKEAKQKIEYELRWAKKVLAEALKTAETDPVEKARQKLAESQARAEKLGIKLED